MVVVAAWKFTCGKRCDEFSALSVSTSIISALFCVVFIAGEKSAVSLPCGSELKFSNDKWIKKNCQAPELVCCGFRGEERSPQEPHTEGRQLKLLVAAALGFETPSENPLLWSFRQLGPGGSSDFLKADFPALLHTLMYFFELNLFLLEIFSVYFFF